MDPCEYCNSRKAVMWNWIDGDICMECIEKRRAIERQKEIDAEIEKAAQERARIDFFMHE